MTPTALITGISGQDGSYLAELLLAKGYEVHGAIRANGRGYGCSSHLEGQLVWHQVGAQGSDWQRILEQVQPTELYHLAAESFVPDSWDYPLDNLDANTGLTIRILEAIRERSPETRMLNACSREIFGNAYSGRADETTVMQPMTPYGIHKAASRWLVNSYRERYGVFAANAILFNHESPRRGPQFVTRKITKRAAEISLGIEDSLELGNLHARRDWGYAGDFVDAMWRMLQIESAEDFVLGTGVTHSIEDLAAYAFQYVGRSWRDHVTCGNHLSRCGDSMCIAADPSKARRLLDWQPSVDLQQLVAMMIDADLGALSSERSPRRAA